jgi:hypothetical protein
MTSENNGIRNFAVYLLTGAAILWTLYALLPKFPGHFLAPLFKAVLLFIAVLIYGYSVMSLGHGSEKKINLAAAVGTGLIITTAYFYLVSFFKVLQPFTVWIFYLLPAFFLLQQAVNRNRRAALLESARSFFKRPPLEYPVFFLPLIFAVLPPTFYDTLVYHLGIPNMYLMQGGFLPTPNFLFANTSIYYEISLIPAVFAGDMVPRLFHFLLGSVFLLAAADFASEYFQLKKRWLTLLLLVSMPVTLFLLTTVKNDLPGAFFIFLGLRSLLKEKYPVTGLFWGFAVGIKYFNALPIAIFLALFLIRNKTFPIKKLAVTALTAAATVAPLLIKNFIFAGNPVFPFLSTYFPNDAWDASRFQLMQNDVGKMYHSLTDFLKLPYSVSFGTMGFGGTLGPQFLIFLPLLLIPAARQRLNNKWFLLSASLLLIFIGGYFTVSLRFIFISAVLLTFYLAAVYESIPKKILSFLLFSVIALNLINGTAIQEMMNRSFRLLKWDGNINVYKSDMFPTFPAIDFVNTNTPTNSQVMLLGEARNFYLKRPYLVASGLDFSILNKHLAPSFSATQSINSLKKDNIDFIILNLNEFNRLQRGYKRMNDQQRSLFIKVLGHLQPNIIFRRGGVFVFKL